MTQLYLFDEQPEKPKRTGAIPPVEKFQGALLLSAIGDALGWPTEFLKAPNGHRLPFKLPIHDFVGWHKLVGGKWWGYDQYIEPGMYSDDTQLALAIARSITDKGEFDTERFAYEELPLWLQYEQGGGRSVKTAARKLVGKNASWLNNFYRQDKLDYREAGANGAAMRNLPIALSNVANEPKMIIDSFLNTIVTHGHPRAILGTIVFALAVNYALTRQQITVEDMQQYLHDQLSHIGKIIATDDRIGSWIYQWNKSTQGTKTPFKQVFRNTYHELLGFLKAIQSHFSNDDMAYYAFVGALNPETKGSGLSTVCCALYLFLKYLTEPVKALTVAANMYGSDTDTIAVFLGALLGAYHGLSAIPKQWQEQVQDHDYIIETATRLHSIAAHEQQNFKLFQKLSNRRDAYFRMLAWEIGLHEMFWDALGKGGVIVHPTLGRGTIVEKIEQPIKREGYTVKLIHIQFDSGQTCVFHSRVHNNEQVSESLTQELVAALQDDEVK
jgi:ADP-ribosylglycohydrolase